jgi:hypothetical protein
MSFYYKPLWNCLVATACMVLIASCANRGTGPTGGPKDITPPEVLGSSPDNHATNVKTRHFEIYFDELVQLEKPTENVIVSPPQKEQPTVKSMGRRISVVLNDSLKANTTYSIDFGDAIEDNNEKNVLHNFALAFATGAVVDTMEISGTVVDAKTLDPVPGVLVGIHSNPADSAFVKLPLLRIGKTNEKGHFAVRGIKNGVYRVYALSDADNDYRFSQPGEGIARLAAPVRTSFRMDAYNDTIRTDSMKIDTIKKVPYVRYLPDTLVLRYFKEDFSRQRFIKGERLREDKFELFFNASNDTLPILKPLNFSWKTRPLLQRSQRSDTLTYWITDTVAAKMDTLKFALYHTQSDSIGRLIAAVDTVQLRFEHVHKKADGKDTKNNTKKTKASPKAESIRIAGNLEQVMDVDKTMRFRFEIPITRFDSTKLHFWHKVDTLWKPLPARLIKEDDIGLGFAIPWKWTYEEQYKIKFDSAAFHNLRGDASEKLEQSFKIRPKEEYSSLILSVEPFIEHAVLELLDANDRVVKTLKAKKGQSAFLNVLPGDYYLRMFVDANENGKWDTGNYAKNIDPEMVYYYPDKITLRANWDIEFDEPWDPASIPLDKQKPKALIKKPEKKL